MSFVCIMYIAERRSQATEGRSQTNVAVLERPAVSETDAPIDTGTPEPRTGDVSTNGDSRCMRRQEFLANNRFLNMLRSKGKRERTTTPPPVATRPRPRSQPPHGRAR